MFHYEKPFDEQVVESGVESGVVSEMAFQVMKLLAAVSLSKTEIAATLANRNRPDISTI